MTIAIDRVGVVIGVVAMLAAAACSKPSGGTTTQLRPVDLPDVTKLEEPARVQVSDAYESLRRVMAEPDATADQLASAYGDLGKLLMAAQFFAAAEPCLDNARRLTPGDARWPYYLGHLYRAENDLDKASAAFTQASAADTANFAALVWQGNTFLDAGRISDARVAYDKAAARSPDDPSVLFGLGRASLAARDFKSAVEQFERILAKHPQAMAVHYQLGLAYQGLGDSAAAKRHLSQHAAGSIDPPDPLMSELAELLHSTLAYEVRADRAMGRGEYAKAAEYYRASLAIKPLNAGARQRLGTALFVSGDVNGAVEEFKAALRIDPGYAKAFYSLGLVFASQGRTREALDNLGAAVRADPSYPEARLARADVLLRIGKFEAALADYKDVLKASPDLLNARLGYAMALIRLERYRAAADTLSEALTVYQGNRDLGVLLAKLLAAAPDAHVRDGARALTIAQAALEAKPTPDAAEANAMALAELGRFDEALEWQDRAISAARQQHADDVLGQLLANRSRYARREACRQPLGAPTTLR